ncbi:hypothetical protein H6501_00270 [Candidatus Woesearchaeota archaeon]|nr:hypothetical protein [Nanoarchaeota archaeon]MCB9370017.1 hypothetical protein [Candidatus Woesearchaeota archaeon]USN44550.1 MAG: hypothetical protein H6500_01740 [Candidatus Woesearchaeota archaeon]
MAASSAEWSIALGILVYIIAFIVAAYFYFKYKRLSLIVFTASVATYIFAVFYTWDIYDLGNAKHWIMLLLLISTGLMFFLGKYFSKFDLEPDKPHTSLVEKSRK